MPKSECRMATSRKSPPPKPTPAHPPGAFTAAELAALDAQAAQTGSRNPAVVREAFFPPALRVGDLVLRELSLGSFMLLEQVDSPLVDDTGAEVTAADLAAAGFILTRDLEVSRDLLVQGRPAFDRAVFSWSCEIPLAQLRELGARIGEAIRSAMSTALPTGQKKTETTPVAAAPATSAASGATASAGG